MAELLRAVALIPARAGSKRVPGKNIRSLAGHPVVAYAIAAAAQSQIFSAIVVSTDSEEIAAIARYYGAEVPFLRPPAYAEDLSPDIEWVDYTLGRLNSQGRAFDCFSILRPTSPFRQAETIQRAWAQFHAQEGIDSLRAVEKCKQHPGKMWMVQDQRIQPLLSKECILTDRPIVVSRAAFAKLPWHSTPYQALPEVYVQNASLEIAWSRVVTLEGTIAGEIIVPFFTHGHEGFDINDAKDWWYAEYLLTQGEAQLPVVSQPPFRMQLSRSEGKP